MKKTFVMMICVCICLSLFLTACSSPSAGEENSTPTTGSIDGTYWKFATLAVGSSWYVYGATIADVASRFDPGLQFDVLPNSGGVGNLLLLQKKQADIGLGFNNVNAWGYNGILAFEENGAIPSLRGLVACLDQMYVGIAVRNGSGIDKIRDIADKKMPIRLMTAEKGSASEYTTRVVLESIGCTYKDIVAWGGSVEHTDFASIVQAFKDGRCDLFMQHISVGHAAFTELCVSADVKVAELDDNSIEFMKTKGYSVAVLPANSFNKQTEEVRCAGITTCLVTTDSLPEEAAYRITKAIYENKEDLIRGHVGFNGFNKELAGSSEALGGLPMHPGAVKYYKEIGLLKD
ncbi:MAG: TAXI family TRAP transporter solute-binding subunit [Firmicutes bacterium]|nr:TAXI family TRAP transporter solute-binding subunit [Bacillota bacterium]